MATKSTSSNPYQVMRSLTTDEYRTLKASIEVHGILEPILVDTQGNIVDGHHRDKAAKQLGIEAPTRVLKGFTPDELLQKAHALNRARRQLSQAEQRDWIAEHLAAEPKASNREIARRVGCDDKTVAGVRRSLIESAELPQDAARTRKPKASPVLEEALSEIVDNENEPEPPVELEPELPFENPEPETLHAAVMAELHSAVDILTQVETDLKGAGLDETEWREIDETLAAVADIARRIETP